MFFVEDNGFMNTITKGKNIIKALLIFSVLMSLTGCEEKGSQNTVYVKASYNDDYDYTSCIITFDPNGGVCDTTSKVVVKGGTYGKLPEPALDDCEFIGWYTDKNEGDLAGESDSISADSEDFTLYARYKSNPGSWQEKDGKKSYLTAEGKEIKNAWRLIEDAWYWFDDTGCVKTGWQESDGRKYYFDLEGKMASGWRRFDGNWYYFVEYPSGRMATGWTEINNNWYHFDNEGIRQSGWEAVGKKWFHFDNTGVMDRGWTEIDGSTFYFDEFDGFMYKGWSKIKGDIYYFNNKGELVRNDYIDGMYVDENGIFDANK